MRTIYVGTDPALALRALQFVQESGIELDGKHFDINVLHDDDCPMLRGGNRCKCDPEFRIRGIAE